MLTVGVASLLASCTSPSYHYPTPVVQQVTPAPRYVVESRTTVAPTPNVQEQTTPQQPQADLQTVIDGVVKLAQSGASEEVQIAYVQSQMVPRAPTAEEVVHLSDIGLSDQVVETMIRASERGMLTSPTLEDQSAGEQLVGSVPPPPSAVAPPVVQSESTTVESQTVVVEQPVYVEQPLVVQQPVVVERYYAELNPYGTWLTVPDYGNCWRPTAAVVDTSWRPYHHRGRWLYSDLGWYWQSDYSWGHIPFHYGRWANHRSHGWIWVPGNTWAPAWVSWRRSSTYCGWAPLPPAARYSHGFHYSGGGIHAHLEFGLGFADYCYVPLRHLHSAHPYRHSVHRDRVRDIHGRTEVINQHIVNNGTLIINQGVPVADVELASRTNVPRTRVQSVPVENRGQVRPDVLERTNDGLVVRAVGAPSRGPMAKSVQEPAGRGQTSSGSRLVLPNAISRTTSRPSVVSTPAASSTPSPQVTRSSVPAQRSTQVSGSSSRTPVSSSREVPSSVSSRFTTLTHPAPENSLADRKEAMAARTPSFRPLSSSRSQSSISSTPSSSPTIIYQPTPSSTARIYNPNSSRTYVPSRSSSVESGYGSRSGSSVYDSPTRSRASSILATPSTPSGRPPAPTSYSTSSRAFNLNSRSSIPSRTTSTTISSSPSRVQSSGQVFRRSQAPVERRSIPSYSSPAPSRSAAPAPRSAPPTRSAVSPSSGSRSSSGTISRSPGSRPSRRE